jgi:hypothetical protein
MGSNACNHASAVTQVGFVCHLTFQAEERFGQVDVKKFELVNRGHFS